MQCLNTIHRKKSSACSHMFHMLYSLRTYITPLCITKKKVKTHFIYFCDKKKSNSEQRCVAPTIKSFFSI